MRFAVRVLQPRIYIGVGYLWVANNYGYPNLNGVGFGGEKLPDLNHFFSFFGSVWYYPSVNGTATYNIENAYPSTGLTSHSSALSVQHPEVSSRTHDRVRKHADLLRSGLDGR